MFLNGADGAFLDSLYSVLFTLDSKGKCAVASGLPGNVGIEPYEARIVDEGSSELTNLFDEDGCYVSRAPFSGGIRIVKPYVQPCCQLSAFLDCSS